MQIISKTGEKSDITTSKLFKSGATISIHGMVGSKQNYTVKKTANIVLIEEIDEKDEDDDKASDRREQEEEKK